MTYGTMLVQTFAGTVSVVLLISAWFSAKHYDTTAGLVKVMVAIGLAYVAVYPRTALAYIKELLSFGPSSKGSPTTGAVHPRARGVIAGSRSGSGRCCSGRC